MDLKVDYPSVQESITYWDRILQHLYKISVYLISVDPLILQLGYQSIEFDHSYQFNITFYNWLYAKFIPNV